MDMDLSWEQVGSGSSAPQWLVQYGLRPHPACVTSRPFEAAGQCWLAETSI